jgi:hypothetical protein
MNLKQQDERFVAAIRRIRRRHSSLPALDDPRPTA